MSSDLLVDTDVFVDHIRGVRSIRPGSSGVWYSSVTHAELFAGRTPEGAIRELLSGFGELTVGREVAELGGAIKRTFGLQLPDALIAATALLNRLDLVTRNLRPFERVPGLRLRESV